MGKGHLIFQNKTSFCDLSFSLKNSLQGRALVTIGNFHGSHTAVLTELERKTKTRMFDFLIQEFIKSSSAHNAKIYASAPSEHHAYQSPSLAAVLHKLKIAKKATNIEIARYANSKRYFNRLEQLGQLSKLDYIQAVALFKQRDTKRIKQIDALVRKEIKRVQIRGTVSHKIAFKKAGFRVKEKMWGIVGKTPDGVLITRPTKMSPPRFRLDPRRFGVKR